MEIIARANALHWCEAFNEPEFVPYGKKLRFCHMAQIQARNIGSQVGKTLRKVPEERHFKIIG